MLAEANSPLEKQLAVAQRLLSLLPLTAAECRSTRPRFEQHDEDRAMLGAGISVRTRVTRGAAMVAGLAALVALPPPDRGHLAGAAHPAVSGSPSAQAPPHLNAPW